VFADFHIGDMASVWKPTPTLTEDAIWRSRPTMISAMCRIDSAAPAGHSCDPMNLFAAFFSFTFAGYFAPQSGGGLSPRNV
jgi:hypothetical protein